ncbi:glycosyltransferase [Candidatus Pelagibacter sp.]|nr:glycosyltransferase [Candidatus Pelagibacter sp.]
MNIAILVPFYNEDDNLPFFIKEWENFLKSRKKIRRKLFFFFIDDGSTDKSVEKIKKNIKKIKFKIIKKRNSGHGDTCKYGYNLIINKYQKFDYLLQIDSDNQCNPKYIVNLYNLIKQKNYNFIFGYRRNRDDGSLRYLISKIMSLTFFFKKFLYIKDLNTPYRIMKVKKLKKVLDYISKNREYENIKLFNCALSYVIQKKYTINWIDIRFRNRYSGVSKFNFLKMFSMFLNFIIKI